MRAKAERGSGPRTVAAGLAEAPAPALAPLVNPEDPIETSIQALQIALNGARGQLGGDPYGNPIALLAFDLLQRLNSGELDEQAVEALIQRLTREAFADRATAAHRYLGELGPVRNRDAIRQLLLRQAKDADGGLASFDVFATRLERVYYGFVFTAHPTFSRRMELQTMLASAAFGAAAQDTLDGQRQLHDLLLQAEKLVHRPPTKLDLNEEHAQSVLVIGLARTIVRQVYEIAFDVARELYPDKWRHLRPGLVTLATWVGYDTDGRADIGWTTTFAKRLILQLDQLRHYRAMVQACVAQARGETLVVSLLELLEARLALAVKSAEDDLLVLDNPTRQDSEWRKRLAKTARDMVKNRGARLTHAAQVLDLLDRALAAVEDDATARQLGILRAELATQGIQPKLLR